METDLLIRFACQSTIEPFSLLPCHQTMINLDDMKLLMIQLSCEIVTHRRLLPTMALNHI